MGVEDFTPAMKQYLQVKERHPDCIVLFRMGDFYEIFFDDAAIAARELSITLTSRNKNKEDSVPLCGFPYHASASYIAKLVERGYKVAICEQMEDPRLAKGLVKREVVRIITPGLITSADNIVIAENVFLASVYLNRDSSAGGASFLDLSTGEFFVTDWSAAEGGEIPLAGIDFRELILPEGLQRSRILEVLLTDREKCHITYYPDEFFNFQEGLSRLKDYLTPEEISQLHLEGHPLCVSAAGALLRYVEETQKTDLRHITKLKWYEADDYVIMDETARRNLELFHTSFDNRREGSLFHLLDETLTALGTRRLRWWLTHPLKEPPKIRQRLAAVAELKGNHVLRGQLRKLLKEIYDIERLGSRVVMALASARDLIALKHSLQILPEIKSLLKMGTSPLISSARDGIDTMEDLALLIERSIDEAAPAGIKEGGIIKKGYDPTLDELRSLMQDGYQRIASLEDKERKRTGISSLKVGFNNIFGYYFEISKASLKELPGDYVRKQTLVNAERYTSNELKEYEHTILSAKERSKEKEYELFVQIRQELSNHIKRIQETAAAVALLDVIAALAEVAERYNYCQPDVQDHGIIEVKGGRHPVVERTTLMTGFVPNDTFIDLDQHRFLIITGPNMAGKSTYIRQVALIVLMAQIGSFVPATQATIGIVDRIFTRIGAADNLARGQSTFMVEMIEVANILKNASRHSLIILDEVGRGTSTFDGMAIAWAVAEYINEHLGARTLFATHYHQLTELALINRGVQNYNIAVKESAGQIIFLRKIVPGGTNRSYGIHVGQIAGLPEEVIGRAKEILNNMEKGELDEGGMPRIAKRKKKPLPPQLSLFGGEEGLIADELRDLDLSDITPLEALNKLSTWQKRLLT